jgi:predicted transcriptional regulator
MGRTYRTRLEVLHDFLDASRRATRKTRVIGLANLNPAYYESYARFCRDHRLLETTDGGYRTTELADQVLIAIRQILSKTTELDTAVRSLHEALYPEAKARELAAPSVALTHTDGWEEILRHSVPRLAWPRVGIEPRDFPVPEDETLDSERAVELRVRGPPTTPSNAAELSSPRVRTPRIRVTE